MAFYVDFFQLNAKKGSLVLVSNFPYFESFVSGFATGTFETVLWCIGYCSASVYDLTCGKARGAICF